jgi:hypothetical protein
MTRKVKNKILYYKETVKCRHLIFWPESQRMAQCLTAKPELNQRVTIKSAQLNVITGNLVVNTEYF